MIAFWAQRLRLACDERCVMVVPVVINCPLRCTKYRAGVPGSPPRR